MHIMWPARPGTSSPASSWTLSRCQSTRNTGRYGTGPAQMSLRDMSGDWLLEW